MSGGRHGAATGLRLAAVVAAVAACSTNPAFDPGSATAEASTASNSDVSVTTGVEPTTTTTTTAVGGTGSASDVSGGPGCDVCEGSCIDGVCVPVAMSCLDYRDAYGVGTSGVYPIDPDGAGPGAPFMVHCEMVADGGGWTLVVKADGRTKTFQYSVPDGALDRWDDPDSFGGPEFDHSEAKLASYAAVPLSELRVGLEYPVGDGVPQPNTLVMPAEGASLYALMAGDVALEVAPSSGSWQALVPDAVLQTGCLRQGLNIRMNDDNYGAARVRIGVIADEQATNVCVDPDSYIGVGARVHCNGFMGSAGGESCWVGGDVQDGLAARLAFGYVWVR